MKNFVFLLLSIVPIIGYTQVNQSIEPTNFDEKKYGPNNKHHVAFTFRYGAIIADEETADSPLSSSRNFGVGFRYKHKLTNRIHFNTELSYDLTDYRFNAIHYVPGTGFVEQATQQNSGFRAVKTAQFIHNNIELAPSFRIRFNKGQGINWFTDLGAYGYFTASGYYNIDGDHLVYGETELESKLIPDNTFGYGYFGRFGYKFVAVYYKYRAQQPFDDFNLQPHTIGLEIILNVNG